MLETLTFRISNLYFILEKKERKTKKRPNLGVTFFNLKKKDFAFTEDKLKSFFYISGKYILFIHDFS